MATTDWTDEQRQIAYFLYVNQVDPRCEAVRWFAQYMGRSTGALQKKMRNIASHDPSRGTKKGLQHSAVADKEIWPKEALTDLAPAVVRRIVEEKYPIDETSIFDRLLNRWECFCRDMGPPEVVYARIERTAENPRPDVGAPEWAVLDAIDARWLDPKFRS